MCFICDVLWPPRHMHLRYTCDLRCFRKLQSRGICSMRGISNVFRAQKQLHFECRIWVFWGSGKQRPLQNQTAALVFAFGGLRTSGIRTQLFTGFGAICERCHIIRSSTYNNFPTVPTLRWNFHLFWQPQRRISKSQSAAKMTLKGMLCEAVNVLQDGAG